MDGCANGEEAEERGSLRGREARGRRDERAKVKGMKDAA